MQLEQYRVDGCDLHHGLTPLLDKPDLVLVFAASSVMASATLFQALKAAYPQSALAGCSTAGEIHHASVDDEGVVITELCFDSSRCSVVSAKMEGSHLCYDAGAWLARQIDRSNLTHVLLFSPGVNVNGSAVIDGMASILENVPISGGLAGDGNRFQQTYTLTPDGIEPDTLCAVCFYGDRLTVEYSCFGGWEPFGPLRKITGHDDNILHELDGRPALDLYKQYLGEYACELPASGLLFPLEMVNLSNKDAGIIRTTLAVNEKTGSLIMAGNIDPDCYMRLMHASIDGLIHGAEAAAAKISSSGKTRLALLVSCIGRKLVMGDETCEELEMVKFRLGTNTMTTGFYSYGEICPSEETRLSRLHNQTMTITVISEG
ncbi:MAG: hypothetical protein EP315_02090 [Gammaproteobacteria bacterium]|nr:MAG: hypothetical protein EP315_02090 [Gammaproteobacteria bacterium]